MHTHTHPKNEEESIKNEWAWEHREVLPSLTGRDGKLIISWCLEAKVLTDNHRTTLGVYIAIRRRDKGWPKALIAAVTRAKPDQPLPCSHLISSSTEHISA